MGNFWVIEFRGTVYTLTDQKKLSDMCMAPLKKALDGGAANLKGSGQ